MLGRSFHGGRVTLHHGDCLTVLDTLPENSVDSVVCDPPYHLTSIVKRFGGANAAPAQEGTDGAFKRASAGFMGKQWDGGDIAFQVETWAKAFRVLKPGGYIIAFSSSRTFGRMSVAIEDAGFITHPMIVDLLSQDGMTGAFLDSLSAEQTGALVRILESNDPIAGLLLYVFGSGFPKATRVQAPGYEGQRYGAQSLKPALEPIYMGQKPFSEATGTANILRWGTGAVNIDGCRVPGSWERSSTTRSDIRGGAFVQGVSGGLPCEPQSAHSLGRWPANLIHDGSPEVVACFPETLPSSQSMRGERHGSVYGGGAGPSGPDTLRGYTDSGSAARFFYSSKADADDRLNSRHPTVKPLDLVRWLVRLVTPKGGTVLDCFAGTGTTGHAALIEGMRAILIERDAEYIADIERRMSLVYAGRDERARKLATVDMSPMPLFAGAAT